MRSIFVKLNYFFMHQKPLDNKKFVNILTLFTLVLTIFVGMKFINEIKTNKYIGGGDVNNIITVSGQGEAFSIPDTASFSFTVEESAKKMSEAQDVVSEKTNEALSLIKEEGVEDKDIKTTNYRAYPKYTYGYSSPCFEGYCPRNKTISGYTVSETVTVKVKDTELASIVAEILADAGVSNLNGPNWGVEDEELLKEEARAKAIENAQKKAKILASQLGVKIVRVSDFHEEGENGRYYLTKAESFDSNGSSSPELEKGENKITSRVTISFEIK